MKIKSKIWIESEEGILLGEGRVKLLKMIEETGSLNKASKSLKISYQKAWRMIDEMNTFPTHPIIKTQIGGSKGGETSLTDYGKSLILIYDTINKDCWKFLDEQLEKHHLC